MPNISVTNRDSRPRRQSALFMCVTADAGPSAYCACDANMPCISALMSAAGGPLPATSPSVKPNVVARIVHVVEEVASDRSARNAGRGGFDEPEADARLAAAATAGFRPRCASPAPCLRLLELVAIEPRVLDGDRRFGRQRFERRRAWRRRAGSRVSRLSRYSTPMRWSSPRASSAST